MVPVSAPCSHSFLFLVPHYAHIHPLFSGVSLGQGPSVFFLFPLQYEADLFWIINKALNIKITICIFVMTINFCLALVHNFHTLPMT